MCCRKRSHFPYYWLAVDVQFDPQAEASLAVWSAFCQRVLGTVHKQFCGHSYWCIIFILDLEICIALTQDADSAWIWNMIVVASIPNDKITLGYRNRISAIAGFIWAAPYISTSVSIGNLHLQTSTVKVELAGIIGQRKPFCCWPDWAMFRDCRSLGPGFNS